MSDNASRGHAGSEWVYRVALLIMASASVASCVIYPFFDAYLPYVVGAFSIGVLLSVLTATFIAPATRQKLTVLFAVGAVAMSLTLLDIPFRVNIFYAGLGLVLIESAAISARDAIRRRHLEGWLFMAAYPVFILINLSGKGEIKLNMLLLVLIALLHALYVRRAFLRARKPARAAAAEPEQTVQPVQSVQPEQSDAGHHHEGHDGDA